MTLSTVHPDLVKEPLKKKAEKAFVELKKAYDLNDFEKVHKIKEDLKNGVFSEDKIELNKKDELLEKVRGLKKSVERLEKEIQELKGSDMYTIISSIGDWEEYFASKKEEFKQILKSTVA